MLCVLFICVICEKKYNCETRWGGFSLIELTELTEPFCARFKLTEGLRPTENTEASPPGGCVKIDTSSFLFFLYLVYDIIRYLLQLCC